MDRLLIGLLSCLLALSDVGFPVFAADHVAPGFYQDVQGKRSYVSIVKLRDGSSKFALYAVRELDLHSGFVSGRLGIGERTWTHVDSMVKCRLHFSVSARSITVAQDARFGGCGFGYGVFADGTYRFDPKRRPLLSDPRS